MPDVLLTFASLLTWSCQVISKKRDPRSSTVKIVDAEVLLIKEKYNISMINALLLFDPPMVDHH